MQRKTINVTGVGEVLLERSLRARHINLSVKPFKGVRIAVPRGVSFQEAEAVAQSKSQWLKEHLGRMALIEQQVLELKQKPSIPRAGARRFLIQRLHQLAARHGFTYNKVFVRSQRTRWGSCSAKNNINLNVNLVHLPDELMDYIIVHELVHTRVKNHGPQFWEALEECLPGAKQLDRQLNQHWMLLLTIDRGGLN